MDKIHETFKNNPLAWGYYFLAHHFPMASPTFHIQILKTVLAFFKTVICAPRGHAVSLQLL
jgi:hypothetical protein